MALRSVRQRPRRDAVSTEERRARCAALEAEFFAERALIIAANRGPVTFQPGPHGEPGDVSIERGEGGLVTALADLASRCGGSWIGAARTPEDVAFGAGDVRLAPGGRPVRVELLDLPEDAYEGYYNQIANPLLWFLQHWMWNVVSAPIITRETWRAWNEGYVPVNRLFAQALARAVAAEPRRALVMLQDYHLYLVARTLRERVARRPRPPTLLHFVHIPWPGPGYWSILPAGMRTAILDSLCAVDLLGFQTREDALDFIRTCESHLPGAEVHFKHGWVWYRGHATHVRDFPISIDVEALKRVAASDEVAAHRSDLEMRLGDARLIVRIDRTEPSKNLVRGFQAYGELLELHPEYHGQVKLLALLVPSRMEVVEYQTYLDELMAAAGRVNAQFGSSQWEPVRVMVGNDYPRAVAALQMYDVLLVNSIADGMNLVAKEGPIVNERDGVLILSERTGARQQLEPGALVIAPADIYATAEAMHQALAMPVAERRALAERLRWSIERDDIRAWLCDQLASIKRLNL
jgi:trehalose 6-phosphate synthase